MKNTSRKRGVRQLLGVLCIICSGFQVFAQGSIFTPEEQAWMERHPIVYFGYDANWPPYAMYIDGKYTGICGDYIQRIKQVTGIRFTPIKNTDWDESMTQIKNGDLDMIVGAGITPERSEYMLFSDPFINSTRVIVTTRENAHLDNLNKLKGKRVSLPRGYMQVDEMRRDYPEIKQILRANFAECLQDVASGISDATVGSLGSLTYTIKDHGFYNLTISGGTDYKRSDIAIGFSLGQDTLRNIVNKALRTIPTSERSRIQSKWISVNVRQEVDYSGLWLYVLIIGGSVFLVLLLTYVWNKSLRKQINLRKQIEVELQYTLEEIKQQNKDKTVLLQEIHHRVKNNLQIIISLLRLQAGSNSNPDTQNALAEAIERINSISLVHEHIYKNPHLGQINLAMYIQNLGEELKRVFIRDKKIEFDIQTYDIEFDIKTIIPIALILNELITNSLKYAFREAESGIILIEFRRSENALIMHYADNGQWFNNPNSGNFGTYLIEIFTEQLSGSFEKISEDHAEYEFRFEEA